MNAQCELDSLVNGYFDNFKAFYFYFDILREIRISKSTIFDKVRGSEYKILSIYAILKNEIYYFIKALKPSNGKNCNFRTS